MAKKDCQTVNQSWKRNYEKMSPKLREQVDYAIDWVQSEEKRSMMSRYSFGEEMKEIHDDNDNGGKIYGPNSWKRVHVALGQSWSIVDHAVRLAQMFTKAELSELCERVFVDGHTRMSYSHIRRLLYVEDKKMRQQAIEKCIANCWTSADLGAWIQKQQGGSRSHNPKGRLAAPKSAEAVIKQQMNFVEEWDSRSARVWRDPQLSLPAQIDKMETEQYTEDLAKQLAELSHRLRQLADDAGKRADEAERRYKLVKLQLDRRLRKIGEPTKEASDEVGNDEEALPASQRRQVVKA